MQILSYPIVTALCNKITRNRTVQSFKDSPRKPLGRRPSGPLFSFRLRRRKGEICGLAAAAIRRVILSSLLTVAASIPPFPLQPPSSPVHVRSYRGAPSKKEGRKAAVVARSFLLPFVAVMFRNLSLPAPLPSSLFPFCGARSTANADPSVRPSASVRPPKSQNYLTKFPSAAPTDPSITHSSHSAEPERRTDVLAAEREGGRD